ncbi:hypothetical protein CHL67_09285 [Prosthecochloris sp. GSB1]|uniref:YncE family protein n=1 Tax=Prosthecochloris sp. GSB1 TaxID=281093 RepID=UPI000B8CF2A5|nr:hypothetical protein [Prosthecochloris sp. GSB1]ASQ91084.1 hypothetical protein CHL67_09285 [Prosthecochloris sp. GSB1]
MAERVLKFYRTGAWPFPYKTTGRDTALTACLHKGEPSLAFLTQTEHEDDFVFLRLDGKQPEEIGRFRSPLNHWRISGIAYERHGNRLWVAEGSGTPHQHADEIVAIDADSGALLETVRVPLLDSHALAFNGMYFVRSDGKVLEMLTRGGAVLATLEVPIGSNCRGLSAAPWTYIASDTESNRLTVISLFGQIVAVCPEPPGYAGGIEAVAFDNIRDFSTVPQVEAEDRLTGEPDTPWDPEPWNFRHRVYLANQKDQTIYFGYFYE